MKKFANTKKNAFLATIPDSSIDSNTDTLTTRCKFNFHYMDFSQASGQEFKNWNQLKLTKLLNKLKNYSEQSLTYWTNQRIGRKNNHVLEIYKDFPRKSKFMHPKHIPHEVHWARFRLEADDRLIGFILPPNYHKELHKGTQQYFDCNVFYVVFLDENHHFYLTK